MLRAPSTAVHHCSRFQSLLITILLSVPACVCHRAHCCSIPTSTATPASSQADRPMTPKQIHRIEREDAQAPKPKRPKTINHQRLLPRTVTNGKKSTKHARTTRSAQHRPKGTTPQEHLSQLGHLDWVAAQRSVSHDAI